MELYKISAEISTEFLVGKKGELGCIGFELGFKMSLQN